MKPPTSADNGGRHWAQVNESTFTFGMRLLFWVCRIFGRWPFRVVLYPVVAWYMMIRPAARKASADYLRRVAALDPGDVARREDQPPARDLEVHALRVGPDHLALERPPVAQVHQVRQRRRGGEREERQRGGQDRGGFDHEDHPRSPTRERPGIPCGATGLARGFESRERGPGSAHSSGARRAQEPRGGPPRRHLASGTPIRPTSS